MTGGKKEKAEQIENWFKSFEDYLKVVFDEKSLKLVFDEDAFHFYISMNNRDTFDSYIQLLHQLIHFHKPYQSLH